MKSLKRLLGWALALMLTFSSCSLWEDLQNTDDDESGVASGLIILPEGCDQTNLKVYAGIQEGSLNGNTYEVKVNSEMAQLTMVLNQQNEPLAFAVFNPSVDAAGSDINASSTAAALIFMNPFFCTTHPDESADLMEIIYSLESFDELVNTIEQSQRQNISIFNEAVSHQLAATYDELTERIDEMYGPTLKSTQTSVNPDFRVNGLQVTELGSNSFKIANSRKRWISIYTEKWAGNQLVEAPQTGLPMPSPDISIMNALTDLATQSELSLTEYSEPLNYSLTGSQYLLVKCYGLGVSYNIPRSEFSRFVLPATLSAVFDFGMPVFELICGAPFKLELRGRYFNDPFYQLVQKVSVAILSDIDNYYERFYRGEITGILVDAIETMFKACLSDLHLTYQILQAKIGKNFANSLVSNFLFPIKVVNSTMKIVNLTYSVASVASSQALTTFQISNANAGTAPVLVNGSLKSFETRSGLSNAVIHVKQEESSIIQAVRTNADGSFSFHAGTGRLELDATSYGYKDVHMTVEINPDIVQTANPVFTLPTIWMSDYTVGYGTIKGTVRDATNLGAIRSAAITLKYGVNDPEMDVLATATSDNNGNFSFEHIPAGTYTAFITKTGYIEDHMTVVSQGNDQITEFSVALSPNIMVSNGYRIVLSWGSTPRDLDSHLFTPVINGSEHHIYYNDKGNLYGVPYANLDVDDVNSYGPETTTITQVYSGDYVFYVHNYSYEVEMKVSEASVSLYGSNGHIRTWNVPLQGNGRWWKVFSIDGSTGQITSYNSISNSIGESLKSTSLDLPAKQ